jgi:hypothetical protein
MAGWLQTPSLSSHFLKPEESVFILSVPAIVHMVTLIIQLPPRFQQDKSHNYFETLNPELGLSSSTPMEHYAYMYLRLYVNCNYFI